MNDTAKNNNLLTNSGYYAQFWLYVSELQEYRDPMHRAWQLVEKDLLALHRCRRYRTYHSFRTGKYKRPRRGRVTIIINITVMSPK